MKLWKAFRLHGEFKIQYYCLVTIWSEYISNTATNRTDVPGLACPWPGLQTGLLTIVQINTFQVFSHLSSSVKVCWTLKPFKRFKFSWGFYFINDSTLPLTKEGRETSRGKGNTAPLQSNCKQFFFANFGLFECRKLRQGSLRKEELLISAGLPTVIPVILLHTYPQQC